MLEYVEACAAEFAVLDHAGKRVLVDHLAARCVDDIGGGFHQGEPARGEQMVGCWRMRAVDGDDVHAGEHLVEAVPVGGFEHLLNLRRHAPAIVIMNLEAESPGALRDRLANTSHANN